MSEPGAELGPADTLISDAELYELGDFLCAGIPLALAAKAAGITNIDQIVAADATLRHSIERWEARGEIHLLKLTALTRPLEVLARTRPEQYGPSVARPLKDGDEGDDDGIDVS